MTRPELQLQQEVTAACRESLARGAAERRALDSPQAWHAWRQEKLDAFRRAFPAFMFKRDRHVPARLVSTHEFDGYRVENVLFESLPGWEVNATVYLPSKPGVYPGVVCPTGHSTKTDTPYQLSAQAIARNGYVVVSFDPPGVAGELSARNEHFTNGLIGYLTGLWSATHFVIDALRCLDYLQTREDVDQRLGFTMTGVSGGGKTSIDSALLDERVAFVAPVCCLAEHEQLHLQDLYTSCPEQFGHGFIAAGLDNADTVALIAPRPCLIVAGKSDTLFDYRSTMRVHEEARRVYAAADVPDRCGLFIDEQSGHDYTLAMANEVVRWANRHIKGTDAPPIPLTQSDIRIQDREKLLCHPSNKSNMFTVNRDEALRLKAERASRPRSIELLRSMAETLLGVRADVRPVRVTRRSQPRPCVYTLVEELDVQPAEFIHLPAVLFTRVNDPAPRPALLWLDEQGKWSALKQGGFLFGPLKSFDADSPRAVHVLTMDLSGLGRLEPEPVAYDLCGWNDIERILTYLSIANARPIMGLRVRDALCALAHLRSRPEVDCSRLLIGGRGIGAIVALHAALLARDVRQVVCLEMLSHHGALTEEFPFAWRQSVVIPGVLRHYDLPELAAAMAPAQVTMLNPLDAQKQPIAQAEAAALYAGAIAAGTVVRCGVDGMAAVASAIEAAV